MRMRSPARFLLGVAFALAAGPGSAQEPLFLRIRPPSAESAAAEAVRARQAREAVWERSDRRARIVIASVCEGCLSTPSQDITAAASLAVRESGEAAADRREPLGPADAPPADPTDSR